MMVLRLFLIALAGIFDPSEKLGLRARGTDFGETLHRWGVAEGDYVEIIFLGPSTERDAIGKVADLLLDPVGFVFDPWQSRLRSTANIGNILGNTLYRQNVDILPTRHII